MLSAIPGASTIRASRATGNVLVLFDPATDPQRVFEAIVALDASPPPEHDPPAEETPAPPPGSEAAEPGRPPEEGAVIDSAGRVVGALLGLGLLGARRLAHRPAALPGAGAATLVASAGAILEGIPALRHAARRQFGAGPTDLAFASVGVGVLTMSANPIGLAVVAVGALRELTEVRARERAWARYADRIQGVPEPRAGARVRIPAGGRAPLAGTVLEGSGWAIGRDGLPFRIRPGVHVGAAARVHGANVVLRLRERPPVEPLARWPARPSAAERYALVLDLAALSLATAFGLATRSAGRALSILLLLSPRAALDGAEAAGQGSVVRLLRRGATVADPRGPESLARPDTLLLDGARVLADGLEVARAVALDEISEAEIAAWALDIAVAAGSPWGPIGGQVAPRQPVEGSFVRGVARASIGGVWYSLAPSSEAALPSSARELAAEGLVLVLRGPERRPLGAVALRPRLAAAVPRLLQVCRQAGVEPLLVDPGGDAGRALALRAGLSVAREPDALAAVRAARARGQRVALVSDDPDVWPAFAEAHLAIGHSSGTRRFPARVDLLVPDLAVVAAAVGTARRRDLAARDALALAVLANAVGLVVALRARPGIRDSSIPVNLARLTALVVAWGRLRGGVAPRSLLARLVDPRPERWGSESVSRVFKAVKTGETGLTSAEAATRQRSRLMRPERNAFLVGLREQLASPMTAVLGLGAAMSLAVGSRADVVLIGAVVFANASVGAVQESQVGHASQELERMASATALVQRDGRTVRIPASEVVPGDVLVLRHGERVAADARVFRARDLEVDEATLTGESLPVPKHATGGTPASRMVLEGSDVAAGRGRAVAVATGAETRFGAIAAALGEIEAEDGGVLSARLGRMVLEALPVAAVGGLLVVLAGLARRRPPVAQVALGASTAVAAVPEGLPLLAGIGQAAVARRLAQRHCLVRRLSSVEALGRVDVACVDKTGTLTEGRLAVDAVVGVDGTRISPADLSVDLRRVLLVAALASPRPTSSAASAHSTDMAVLAAAEQAGLGSELEARREAEAPFVATRPFHAAIVDGRLVVKGAADALVARCTHVRRDGRVEALDERARSLLLEEEERLAAEGLRVLFVAEGRRKTSPLDPQELVALGFLAISDPLRPGVAEAVRRCRVAGVRMIMLTGDHPVTARTVAQRIGLVEDGAPVVTGEEIVGLHDDELARRLEQTAVVARISPLEKLRIVESLQRRGHVVAMTGDGVNDAPALRLADVGVAMGAAGTEVARQAADAVLADDDVTTLVEALIEGRGFWRAARSAIGMLLGGNLGEVVFIVGSAFLGLPGLTARQILAVNIGSDVLPAVSLIVQEAPERDLGALAREGDASLGRDLWDEIVHRAAGTAIPSIAALVLAHRLLGPSQAQGVAFASVIATQLAQTLDVGMRQAAQPPKVAAATSGAAALVVLAFLAPPSRRFLALAPLSPIGWALVALTAGAAIAVSRGMATAAP